MRTRTLTSQIVGALCLVSLWVVLGSPTAFAANAPTVESEFVQGVGYTAATLHATIGSGEASTTYRFEYGPTVAYGTAVPVPDAAIGSGSSLTEVSQQLTGLTPSASYHYRVLAINANGTTEGVDKIFTTYLAEAGTQADSCPNAQFRSGLSSALPDCRAYEMISPLDKNGSEIEGQNKTVLAAVNGNRAVYAARAGFGETSGSGAGGVTEYLATRSAAGWESQGVTPTPAIDAWQTLVGVTFFPTFSEGLDRGIVDAYDLPEASNDASKVVNLYVENTLTKELETATTPLGSEPVQLQDLGASYRSHSGDLGVITFETPDNMLPETNGMPTNEKLYAFEHGALHLAGILPDGSIPVGGSASPNGADDHRAAFTKGVNVVSNDGSRIFFMSPADESAAPQLYMRKAGSSTIWISRPESTTPDPEPQNVHFEFASKDGTKVLFASTDRLTDTDPGGAEFGLYLYTDTVDPSSESNLTFIARVNTAGARPASIVSGMSEDARRIYFNSSPAPGLSQEGTYIWEQGHPVKFAIPLKTGEMSEVENTEKMVSTDGRHFAFLMTSGPLTRQDVGLDKEGHRYQALYLYNEPTSTLVCVSCPPSGAAAMSDARVDPDATNHGFQQNLVFPPRFLTRDGAHVFFSTADPLVPRDTNGLYDVYDYNTETGKVSLLSTGTGDQGSWYGSASMDGSDVLFLTSQSLVAADTDGLVDLYDARVGGGFPEPSPPPPACLGDACQGLPSASPTFGTGSAFSGLGNRGSRTVIKSIRTKSAHKKARRKAKRHKRAKKSDNHVRRQARHARRGH